MSDIGLNGIAKSQSYSMQDVQHIHLRLGTFLFSFVAVKNIITNFYD